MPALDSTAIPGVLRRPEVVGVFVGGCVDRGDGSSFRSQAHAHTAGGNRGWICIRAARRLSEEALLKHELAHILSGQGHTAKFRKVLTELCGGVLPKGERMIPRAASSNCRALYHGLCRGKTEAKESVPTYWYEGGYPKVSRVTWSKARPVTRCQCWCHERQSR